MSQQHASLPKATLRTAVLSVPLALVPIIGPVAASWIGCRGARGGAVVAGLIVAGLWAGALWWVSGQSVNVSGTTVTLGPLAFLIPVVAGGLAAGGLLAQGRRATTVTGVLVLAVGTAWSGYQFGPVWTLVGEFGAQPQAVTNDPGGCPENLKKLYTAARLYADSWDDMLPPADVWMDRLSEYVGDENAMACPAVGDAKAGKHGYAMNRALGSKAIGEASNPQETPLYYDSSTLERNANDDVSSLPSPGRHGGKNNSVYLDGHVTGQARP